MQTEYCANNPFGRAKLTLKHFVGTSGADAASISKVNHLAGLLITDHDQ